MNKLSNQIRVAYVIGQLTLGGSESQLLELVRHLNHNKFKILVICLSKQAPLANSFVEAGCEVRILNREERGRLMIFLDLYRLWRLFKPDIVHSYAYASRAAMPISKIFSKCKNIVSIRTQPGWQVIWLDQFLNSFADCVLTNSKKAAESVRFGFHEIVPCQVVYNGIDLQKFDTEADLNFDLELPLNSDTRVICVVARLHPVKGLDVLLDAFTIISKILDNIQLWIVGDGPEREKLERHADQLGVGSKVVFWGQQENIPSILRQVGVGVLSSLIEGLPNAIIEYMAAKLPVVTTDVGGNREVVVNNQTGLMVSFGDTQAFADAILYFLQNPDVARQFGESGRRRVEENFTIERMVRETESVYKQLMTSGKC